MARRETKQSKTPRPNPASSSTRPLWELGEEAAQKLCAAINHVPDLRVMMAVDGGGQEPIWIWVEARSLDALAMLAWSLDVRQCGHHGWRAIAQASELRRPVRFMVEGPPGAFEAAHDIARLMLPLPAQHSVGAQQSTVGPPHDEAQPLPSIPAGHPTPPPEEAESAAQAMSAAINQLPGVRVLRACHGHGEAPFRVSVHADSMDALPRLALPLDGRPLDDQGSDDGWLLIARSDGSPDAVSFTVEGPAGAYEAAHHIAHQLAD